MENVDGKVAFITGAAGGIGLGMARAFSLAGLKVVIADLHGDQLAAAAEQLGGAAAGIHSITLDVTDHQAMARAADEAERVFGRVHILCNNACINVFKAMDDCTREDWQRLVDVNLWGVVNGITTFVPRIKAHGEGGHIVNTASMAAIIGGPNTAIYSMTKFAVRGLSESLWYDLHPRGIGVSVLCPGLVNSRIHQGGGLRPGLRKRLAQVNALGMDPDEVGEKVLAGIRRDSLFIFPHPEFKDEVKQLFDEILTSMPEGGADPRRLELEEQRRRIAARLREAGNR